MDRHHLLSEDELEGLAKDEGGMVLISYTLINVIFVTVLWLDWNIFYEWCVVIFPDIGGQSQITNPTTEFIHPTTSPYPEAWGSTHYLWVLYPSPHSQAVCGNLLDTMPLYKGLP